MNNFIGQIFEDLQGYLNTDESVKRWSIVLFLGVSFFVCLYMLVFSKTPSSIEIYEGPEIENPELI